MGSTQFLDRAVQGEIFPDIPQQIESDRALSAWSQSLCTKWLEMTWKLQGFGGQRYMNLSEGCNKYAFCIEFLNYNTLYDYLVIYFNNFDVT